MGVSEDSDALGSRITDQLPVVRQINTEFRDPVSFIVWDGVGREMSKVLQGSVEWALARDK